MAYPTFKPVVDQVITLMGQVSGSAVQQYTEPLVKISINRVFDYLWDKRKWEHLWTWQTKAIGVDGKLTSDITNVRMFSDIDIVRDAQTKRAIVQPYDTEHLYVTGSSPLFYTILPWNDPLAETRFFKFWPVGATASVELFLGIRPDTFESDDAVIPMDWNLIVFGTVWFMLADNGINPASADKYQGMFDLTYQQIVSRLNAKPIGQGIGRRNGSTVLIQP